MYRICTVKLEASLVRAFVTMLTSNQRQLSDSLLMDSVRNLIGSSGRGTRVEHPAGCLRIRALCRNAFVGHSSRRGLLHNNEIRKQMRKLHVTGNRRKGDAGCR